MDIETPTLAVLAGLALADSVSLGALAVPVWLLLAPRLRPARVMTYLVTLGTFYFGVGVLLVLGARPLLAGLNVDITDPRVQLVCLTAGIALLVGSFFIDGKAAEERRARRGGGRLTRWRDRAVGESTAVGTGATRVMTAGLLSVAGLALAAGVAEIATMLPYIAAVGLIASAGTPLAVSIALLAGYCVVMMLPAAGLLLLRLGGGRHADALLTRIDRWFARSGASLLAWLVGIVGVILIVHNLRVVLPGASDLIGLG